MRFDLNNPHLLIELIYGDVMITFKDARIADEDPIATIGKHITETCRYLSRHDKGQ